MSTLQVAVPEKGPVERQVEGGGRLGGGQMASVALHGKEAARCGQQEGDEKEVLALTVAWTQGGHRQVTGESRVALELPWRLTT